MTTTCLPNPSCMPRASGLSPAGSMLRTWLFLADVVTRVARQLSVWHMHWRQTQTLSTMDAMMLQDIGAPHWLKLRGQAQQNLESYEQFKAMARLKY